MLPFEDSRRLTGGNLFFDSTGAVLEVVATPIDDELLEGWRGRLERAFAHLGWLNRQRVIRRHAGGASLAIAAPVDQLFLATEVNEWALCATLLARDPVRWSGLEQALRSEALASSDGATNADPALAPVVEESAALSRFERLARLEARPALRTLLAAAAAQDLPYVLDESELTLGSGVGGRSFPLAALPPVGAVRWERLHGVPTALVTGSNGKTTTVRLIAACAQASGLRAAYNCTDGVFIDDVMLASGDYSGPAGTRMVLREQRAQAAILEVARGGILRRGIAITRADTAVVTNVSSDHFGEYGIDDLAALAQVKLSVVSVVAPTGVLVLNGDDPLLRAHADGLERRFGRRPPLGWFALDADQATLRDYRARGASTCGARDGRLRLSHRGVDHDLGPIAAMPLSVGGLATYNIANLAGAALAAITLGIPVPAIAAVFARFGDRLSDNPGRLMRFDAAGVRVLIDYAHNPEGLRGLLTVAAQLRAGSGRLGLLLGHAGNRKDADIQELARTAAGFRPDLVVVKENETQLRGRALGEVPQIIRHELLRQGLPESALPFCPSELEAVRHGLDWARPGDVLVLPVHSASARAAVVSMLSGAQPGGPPMD